MRLVKYCKVLFSISILFINLLTVISKMRDLSEFEKGQILEPSLKKLYVKYVPIQQFNY